MTTTALDALLAHNPECHPNNMGWCEHDDMLMAVRDYMINGPDFWPETFDEYPDLTPEVLDSLGLAVDELNEDEHFQLALELSLCPLHLRDYAICFDDEDEECEDIREEHPEHDT